MYDNILPWSPYSTLLLYDYTYLIFIIPFSIILVDGRLPFNSSSAYRQMTNFCLHDEQMVNSLKGQSHETNPTKL